MADIVYISENEFKRNVDADRYVEHLKYKLIINIVDALRLLYFESREILPCYHSLWGRYAPAFLITQAMTLMI